ncbi:hypothetical protein H0H87_004730 [Tephrocybe sp. NHM501043]|nr:hypothetical protein H0H87_004730 [Tephrocybe sp. NHM501043]
MEPNPVTSDKDSAHKLGNSLPSASEKDLAGPHSDDPVFEDYLYYAAIQRRFEDGHGAPDAQERKGNWMARFSEYKGANVNINLDARDASDSAILEDSDRVNALRALRRAHWASVFYLITTDILGPFNAPFAISQVGWVPGTLPWNAHRADSYSKGTSCVQNVWDFTLTGGQSYGWLANSAVWCVYIEPVVMRDCSTWSRINLLIIFISMGVVAHSPANFEAASRAFGIEPGPVVTEAFVSLPLFNKAYVFLDL